MRIKKLAKGLLAEAVYRVYRCGLLKNPLSVAGVDETIEELLKSEKSFVRFGDGEIRLIAGDGIPLQKADSQLAMRLSTILGMKEDRLMIGIPYIFDSLNEYRLESRRFWKEHLLFFRKKYERYCHPGYRYYNAFFSRLYYMYDDRELSSVRFAKIREIWKGKNLIIVESKSAHTGVDNDLLSMAASVRRVICPERDAFDCYNKIMEKLLTYERDVMILLSVGATAKPMVVDLMEAGYRAVDIGSLDMEYQWYSMDAKKKCHLEKKDCITLEQDREAGYEEYIGQIEVIFH